ncbi:cystathionine gamma-synthase [Idiomarina tyrosinivorans]|uniref:Cytochrome c-type biogenesis protein n=1 Tax=Idiomarina tyrosinivorans TaxID=1445662 RepID=A0A432ZPM9_9GAMM|nr:cytochrome c-type biogenesis protein [Idiomarina tyrosinivorans]RUO79788.1 cystathionine gamma-synthase [Idiomarina tyrosinivorans]
MRAFLASVLLVLVLLPLAHAQITPYPFENDQQRQQFQRLTEQLRCPKCQNQNIADSHAGIAKDLRDKTYEMVMAGRSDEEIVDYMVARYGQFVTYKPQLTASTSILWWAPALVILIGLGVMISLARRRRQNLSLSEEERQRLQQLEGGKDD